MSGNFQRHPRDDLWPKRRHHLPFPNLRRERRLVHANKPTTGVRRRHGDHRSAGGKQHHERPRHVGDEFRNHVSLGRSVHGHGKRRRKRSSRNVRSEVVPEERHGVQQFVEFANYGPIGHDHRLAAEDRVRTASEGENPKRLGSLLSGYFQDDGASAQHG